MNLIGHPYVAWKIFKPFTWHHIVGSYLPDLVPFVTTTLFSFDEMHEGGERFFQFLKEKEPEAIGLALGMLAHGVKYGADQYSRKLEEKYDDHRAKLVDEILLATPNLTYDMAYKARFHNFLWWGIDVWIMNNENDFMLELRRASEEVNIGKVAKLISNCFNKDEGQVAEALSSLEPIFHSPFKSTEELAQLWRGIARGLPEKDEVDVLRTGKLFEHIAEIESHDWRQILDEVVEGVRSNLSRDCYVG
jgi:hypothetical protein